MSVRRRIWRYRGIGRNRDGNAADQTVILIRGVEQQALVPGPPHQAAVVEKTVKATIFTTGQLDYDMRKCEKKLLADHVSGQSMATPDDERFLLDRTNGAAAGRVDLGTNITRDLSGHCRVGGRRPCGRRETRVARPLVHFRRDVRRAAE